MLDQLTYEHVICIDIETVPVVAGLGELDENFQQLWERKTGKKREEGVAPEDYFFENAGIFAEFGKVICIAVGIFTRDKATGQYQLRLKSFSGDEERTILQQFAMMLDQYYGDIQKYQLCGHNIREFDVPYLCRRMLVNEIPLPKLLDLSGLKPWEVPLIDTMQLWKFGDYKNYTSLHLLASLLNIPTPKDDIDGSDVGRVYWKDGDLERIKTYCIKDVITVAQLLLRLRGKRLLEEEQITIAE